MAIVIPEKDVSRPLNTFPVALTIIIALNVVMFIRAACAPGQRGGRRSGRPVPQVAGRWSDHTMIDRARPDAVARRFRLIVLDWDGTAVENRHVDAPPIRDRLVRVMQLGVDIVITMGTNFTTGTNFGNIDRQLCQPLNDPSKVRLFISTNRGSEVYGFGMDMASVLRYRCQATPEEDRLLAAIVDAVRDAIVARSGLQVDTVLQGGGPARFLALMDEQIALWEGVSV